MTKLSIEEEIEKILSQAYADGASDTMWLNDRHVEIFAQAKQALIELVAKARVDELEKIHESLKPQAIVTFDMDYEESAEAVATARLLNKIAERHNKMEATLKDTLKDKEGL